MLDFSTRLFQYANLKLFRTIAMLLLVCVIILHVFPQQKQYVFIHRALMEYSQFGNTELTISQLKEAYSNHTHHDSLDDSSPLEKEFEVIGSYFLKIMIAGVRKYRQKEREIYIIKN